jgi:hypothetical protein
MVSVRHASVKVPAATLLLLAMCAPSLFDAGVMTGRLTPLFKA